MEDKLREYFPAMDQIGNAVLITKVVATWARGMEIGGLSWEDVDEMPFTILMDTGATFMQKTQGMVKLAVSAAEIFKETYGDLVPINMDHIIAGAILLDVGKLVEIERDGAGGWRKSHRAKLIRHPVYGAMICWECGIPEEICNMVAFHSSEGEKHPRTPESWIMHHVDFIMFDPFKALP